jgi:type IV secretory pathway VirJ component
MSVSLLIALLFIAPCLRCNTHTHTHTHTQRNSLSLAMKTMRLRIAVLTAATVTCGDLRNLAKSLSTQGQCHVVYRMTTNYLHPADASVATGSKRFIDHHMMSRECDRLGVRAYVSFLHVLQGREQSVNSRYASLESSYQRSHLSGNPHALGSRVHLLEILLYENSHDSLLEVLCKLSN